jgi:ATP-dependent Clp protease ATP-binding subunit ClpA
MPFSLDIPFFAVRLRIHGGAELLMPLNDSSVLSVNEDFEGLRERFEKAFQEKVINKKKLEKLLDIAHQANFQMDQIEVSFPASRQAPVYPAFQIHLDFCYHSQEDGVLGFIPALGIESFSDSPEHLKTQLRKLVSLDFRRNQRLAYLGLLIPVLWYETKGILKQTANFKIPFLKEGKGQLRQQEERLLPRLAQPIEQKENQLFHRNKEVQIFREALENPFSRSILIVGAGGVGKTAIVREIARQLQEEGADFKIWETTASVLIKELMGDTGWQDNLPKLIQELSEGKDALFVNNLKELFEVGQYVGNDTSIGAFLQKYLERGTLTLIAECTEEEKNRIELMHPNYLNPFHIISLEEPPELEKVILQRIEATARQLGVELQKGAIQEIIRLYRRFSPYSGFPGKPVRFLESALLNHEGQDITLSSSDIIRLYCEESGMPQFIVDPDAPLSEPDLKAFFYGKLFGQDKAIERLANILISVKTAMTRREKPIASLLFAGPTGVGKTELAKILAEFMFGQRDRMLRFDMSEYSSPYSVLRLTGLHYFDEGTLTSAIRREPFSVVLFDEIEKADPSFYDLLLQILDEGRLSDSRGELVNFCSSIIIMTSNIGADSLKTNRIGWKNQIDMQEVENHFLTAIRRHFRPELYNRIDQIIPFTPLSAETVRFVLEREIDSFKKREGIQFRNLDLKIEEDVLDYLGRKGYDPKYGARQLKRCIREELIIPLARQLNLQDYYDRLFVRVYLEKDKIAVNAENDPLGLDLFLEELEKINLADSASDLRRSIQRMENCPNYQQVLNKIDFWEREKKEKGDTFWENTERAREYAFFIAATEQLNEFHNQIKELEDKLSISCAGFLPYQAQWDQDLQLWQNNLLDFQVELLSFLKPAQNLCYLVIYGKAPQMAVEFYLGLIKKKGFEYELDAIWKEESSPPADNQSIRTAVKGYWKVRTFEEDQLFIPPTEDALFVGAEITLSGPLVFAYLEMERGKQVWKSDQKKSSPPTYIKIEKKSKKGQFRTPAKPESQDLFPGQPRRILSRNHLQDTALGINREVSRRYQLEMILEKLDSDFVRRIKEAWA